LDPGNVDALLGFAWACQDTKRYDEYLEAAQAAVRVAEKAGKKEELANAYWDLGWAYYRLRRWQDSVSASEKAVSFNESLAVPRFNLALALLRINQVERARQEYLRAIQTGDLTALKNDGISDVTEILTEEPDHTGAAEILAMLKTQYEALKKRHANVSHARSGTEQLKNSKEDHATKAS
jgi:tetratricopeptide (TPR) repeat protein